ncbi:hypothetical protein [Roseiconus lacunae]|uniref:hypothetical protein n=1 Tax=Roseiconus lacunae TaxID=2605694 RepID=UPI0011F2A05B|nr:hypothetical protein [Roseiconus lacunae]
MSFNEIWKADDERVWNQLFQKYWAMLRPESIQVEFQLNQLRREDLVDLTPIEWFNFLHDRYFVWKYTAKNRLATTRANLATYKTMDQLGELDVIRKEILQSGESDPELALKTASQIRGLGVAGASGLLSLIYPDRFATVDQFIVKALLEVPEEASKVESMNSEGLTVADGSVLTEIIVQKARSMQDTFKSNFWMPRTLEMALWAYRGA